MTGDDSAVEPTLKTAGPAPGGTKGGTGWVVVAAGESEAGPKGFMAAGRGRGGTVVPQEREASTELMAC